MIIVYAIKSRIKDWIYVGQTNDLDRRLSEHNSGLNKSTKPYAPFDLIFQEEHPNREAARIREKYFKTASGKRKIRMQMK